MVSKSRCFFRRSAQASAAVSLGLLLLLSVGVGKSAGQSAAEPAAADVLFQRAKAMEKELAESQTDTDRERILLSLAKLYRQIHRYDRAIETYERMRDLEGFDESPNRESVLLQMGSLQEGLGDIEAAAEVYRAYLSPLIEGATERKLVISPSPVSPIGFQVERRLVNALSELGRTAEAKRILFIMAGRGDPQQSAYALSHLVNAYEDGNMSDAELGEIADRLLSRFPEEAVRLAAALDRRDRKAAARYFYDEVLKQSPESLLPAAESVAQFYRSQDSLDQVIADLEKADEMSKNTVRLLVRFYRFKGELDRAISLLEGNLEEQEDPVLMRELANLRMASGDNIGAATIYEKYIEKMPRADSEVYRRLGEAYYFSGEKERAVEVWSRMPEALGKSPSAYLKFSEILDQYGFPARAVEMMEEAVVRAPHSSYYVSRLLNLYLKNERYDEAIGQLTQLTGSLMGLDRIMTEAILRAVETPEAEAKLLEAANTALGKASAKAGDILLDLIFQIHLRSGDFEGAVDQIRQLPSPRREVRLYVLGQSLGNLGEIHAAAEAYRAIPPKSPYYTASRLEAVEALIEAGEYREALDFTAEAVHHLTGSATAAAIVAGASPDQFQVVADIVSSSTDWEVGRRNDLERILVALGDLRVRQKDGGAALALLLLAWEVPPEGRGTSSRVLRRAPLLMGHAYALLGDFHNARRMYETASHWTGPSEDEGLYMLAELDLWEGEPEKALADYEELLQADLSREITNDVLERIYFLSQLPSEEAEIYGRAVRFAWQGRWTDAIDRFRTLAAKRKEDHIADWCLFAIGKISVAQGNAEAARSEWQRLLEETEDVSLRGRIRLELVELETERSAATPEEILERYRRIIEEMPETIFADVARRRINGI